MVGGVLFTWSWTLMRSWKIKRMINPAHPHRKELNNEIDFSTATDSHHRDGWGWRTMTSFFIAGLTLILIFLKVTGAIALSWFWVFGPMILLVSFAVVFWTVVICLAARKIGKGE